MQAEGAEHEELREGEGGERARAARGPEARAAEDGARGGAGGDARDDVDGAVCDVHGERVARGHREADAERVPCGPRLDVEARSTLRATLTLADDTVATTTRSIPEGSRRTRDGEDVIERRRSNDDGRDALAHPVATQLQVKHARHHHRRRHRGEDEAQREAQCDRHAKHPHRDAGHDEGLCNARARREAERGAAGALEHGHVELEA